MDYPLKPIDHNGNTIGIGDMVTFIHAPDSLMNGLPKEDQEVIAAQVGNVLKVAGFNQFGMAELEFEVRRPERYRHTKEYHTIWVEPEYLEKTH